MCVNVHIHILCMHARVYSCARLNVCIASCTNMYVYINVCMHAKYLGAHTHIVVTCHAVACSSASTAEDTAPGAVGHMFAVVVGTASCFAGSLATGDLPGVTSDGTDANAAGAAATAAGMTCSPSKLPELRCRAFNCMSVMRHTGNSIITLKLRCHCLRACACVCLSVSYDCVCTMLCKSTCVRMYASA